MNTKRDDDGFEIIEGSAVVLLDQQILDDPEQMTAVWPKIAERLAKSKFTGMVLLPRKPEA